MCFFLLNPNCTLIIHGQNYKLQTGNNNFEINNISVHFRLKILPMTAKHFSKKKCHYFYFKYLKTKIRVLT